MELRIVHFYPDLMSLYGSYANVALLRRHLEDLGNTVTVETVDYGQAADIASADFVFMGAGTERSQKAALADFTRFAEEIRTAAEGGTAMLFAGTAMELLGKTITDCDGKEYAGIGLGNFSAVQGKRHIVGDVYGHTDLYPQALVGFMNKSGTVTGVETPLVTDCAMGFGNEKEGGPEGFRYKNVLASQLTGPLLVKNPALLNWVIEAIYARRGAALPTERPAYPYEEQAYAVTEEQLKKRSEKQA
jgi:CobQ-like glutamine amidotransferase family enzyme